MKRLIFKYLSIICGLAAAASCTYEYEADIPSDTSVVIIDGRIVAGSLSTISITQAIPLRDNTQHIVYASRVSGRLECDDGSFLTSEGGYAGIEFDTRAIDASRKYKVSLDSDLGSFESDWISVYEAPVIDKLTCTESGPQGSRYLDFRVSAHSASSPYFALTYTEAWEHTSLTTTMLEYFPQTNTVEDASWIGHEHPYYRCWQESEKPITVISSAAHAESRITDAYLTMLSENDLRISVLYRIIVNVSSTGKDYYEYWDNLRTVSYVDGDLFTPIPSNMEGNIHRTSGTGTVIGFLGAGKAAIDTLYYKNRGFYRTPQSLNTMLNQLMHYQRDYENPGDLNEYYCPASDEWPDAYNKGDVPIREAMTEQGSIPGVYVWGNKACVDCRTLGGGLSFPEDWPDRNDRNL